MDKLRACNAKAAHISSHGVKGLQLASMPEKGFSTTNARLLAMYICYVPINENLAGNPLPTVAQCVAEAVVDGSSEIDATTSS